MFTNRQVFIMESFKSGESQIVPMLVSGGDEECSLCEGFRISVNDIYAG